MNDISRNMPVPNPETKAFWDACREQRLLIQSCSDCGHRQFYPRLICSECSSRDVDWVEACGSATIKSFTIMRMAISPAYESDIPYVIALVSLDEGPTMMTNVVNCDLEALAIGMDLQVQFRRYSDEISVPVFAPVDLKT